MKYLFTTEDSFELEGLGCVIVTSFPLGAEIPAISVGDQITLQTPKDVAIASTVKGIPMINYRRVPDHLPISIQLDSTIKKRDIPPGTKVFLGD